MGFRVILYLDMTRFNATTVMNPLRAHHLGAISPASFAGMHGLPSTHF